MSMLHKKHILTIGNIKIAFHRRICPEDFVYLCASIIKWRGRKWQNHNHLFKHGRTFEYQLQEINLMIVPFKFIYLHFFESGQWDNLGSPVRIVTSTIMRAFMLQLKKIYYILKAIYGNKIETLHYFTSLK
jgi:hypothetical protein